VNMFKGVHVHPVELPDRVRDSSAPEFAEGIDAPPGRTDLLPPLNIGFSSKPLTPATESKPFGGKGGAGP
jgi:hypothetical protein